MQGETLSGQRYVLGDHAEELARLDHQAGVIERPTRLLLQAAGLTTGMRVLDLGTGLGHVARLAGELVGPTGSVLAVDQSSEFLAVAQERTRQAGMTHVSFAQGNALEWIAQEKFDAVLARLLLFHLPDPIAAVRHHAQNLRAGGMFVAVDFDLGGCRSEPMVPIVDSALRWVQDAFRAAGAWPRIGAKLGTILEDAQLTQVTTFGVQAYLSPRDPAGPRLLSSVVRSLSAVILARGIATADQMNLETLETRIAEATRQAGAVILPPTVVGAWGRTTG